MPNYGFNENEIVATKTIQIDKDGFHRIVEGTDGGSSTPDEGSASGGLKDFNAAVTCDSENVEIHVMALVRMGSGIHTALSDTISVGIAIDPLNSMDPSTLPKTMSVEDMTEFTNTHTFLSPDGMTMDASSDQALWFNDAPYMMYGVVVPDSETPSELVEYTLPVGDLQSQEKIAQIFDTDTSFHYEFDLTILVASATNDDEVHEIFADTVHVTTPVYMTDMG